MATPRQVWEPSDVKSTQIYKFKSSVERTFNTSLPDYNSLFQWSIQNRSDFWSHCLRSFPIIYSGTIPQPCVDESAPIQSIPIWFRGVHLNFAENILFTRSGQSKEDDKVAITQVREPGSSPVSHITWSQLRKRVGRLSNAMRARGIQKGDRVALIASTSIDTLTVFLASAAVGALFSSSSTDMGVTGLLDRLTQIKPKLVFFDDAAVYNGKTIDLRSKIAEVIAGMKGISEFENVVVQPRFEKSLDVTRLPRTETWQTFISSTQSDELTFEKLAFHDPLLIVYSSGTTGPPKCIVHSHGGIVLNGHKEQSLHRAVSPSSVCLQFTTTGWIMYLGSVQALLTGARMICYDGSPFHPDPTYFVKLLGIEKVTHLGTSPRYLATLQQKGLVPKEITDLSSLEVITSTGSVLSEGIFQWLYDTAFPPHVQLDNISGGTDLAGAWGTGNPMLPVYVGGCQCLSLGMAVEVYEDDPSDPSKGKRAADGQPGDLVCTAAFPSMPVFFWGDRDGKTYHDSYFAKYQGVWTHGDFIQIAEGTGQVVFLGRADGVLNPSGVRFGSSEIYNVIERHFPDEIVDTICVGQRRKQDTDEQVLLFVLMAEGKKFGPGLIRRLRDVIGKELSKRHVPKFIFETKEIPTTVNGKKVELPVKRIVSGEKVKVSGTLANPESLEFYKRFVDDEVLKGVERAKL